MKQNLQFKLSQQLTMTPQLQQAIKLLQLSTLELQQELQTALESNPLLELDNNYSEITVTSSQPSDVIDSSEAMEKQNIPEELPLDTNWNEYYTASISDTVNKPNDDSLPYLGETVQSLQSYLMWQLDLSRFSEVDHAIGIAIIESINEQGYLTCSTEDIFTSLAQSSLDIEQNEVDIVLKRIQHFDPIGIGARNLQECLLLQLKQLEQSIPWRDTAILIVEQYLSSLGNRDFKTILKHTQLTENDLKQTIALIQSLNPRPGLSFSSQHADYVLPDVIVQKHNHHWYVELNHHALPKLKINQHYAALANTMNTNDSRFIRTNLQDAHWLIKSLENRNDTLIKVSRCIVEQQQDFFEYGTEYMKPMVLADIARAIDMHESTISRVTTRKYLHCPRGIFELKYFFSSHVNTEEGGGTSSTAIRALIKKLIMAEPPKKPLSDSKIVTLLAEQGIIVARRTVAKYRESLAIPPSNQRKELS